MHNQKLTRTLLAFLSIAGAGWTCLAGNASSGVESPSDKDLRQSVAADVAALTKARSSSHIFVAAYGDEDFLRSLAPSRIRFWQQAAIKGFPEGQLLYGLCFDYGAVVTNDTAVTMKWYRMAAEQGYAPAQYQLGLCYSGLRSLQIGTGERKWAHFENGEKGDDMDAAWDNHRIDPDQKALHDKMASRANKIVGAGLTNINLEAVKWFRKAAEQGYVPAQLQVWYEYLLGYEGVPRDKAEALRWCRKAADGGGVQAQRSFGDAYRDGNGVPKDEAEAVKWYRKAADGEGVEGQRRLGDAYRDGTGGLPKNEAESVTWYRKAADGGDKRAMFQLGGCYHLGKGVPKDCTKAVMWYRMAANLGNVDAMFAIGVCYDEGDGVPKDSTEAVKWYQKAADLGDGGAMGSLGYSYLIGEGVIQSDVQACFHLLVAGALGNQKAGDRVDKLRTDKLSRTEYAEAQRMAAEWMEKFKSGSGNGGTKENAEPQFGKTQQLLGSGSGFVLSDDGYFLTCAHVVKGGGKIKVRVGGTTYQASLVKLDKVNDVALLKLDGKGFKPVPLRHELPEMGAKVFTVGFPNPDFQGSAAKYTDGSVSALTGIRDDIRTIQITVPVQPGNSGGPLADETGNVVGIVVSKLNAATVFEYTGDIPQNVNFAVKIGYAMPLIQSVPGLGKRLPSARDARKGVNMATELEKGTGMVLVYR